MKHLPNISVKIVPHKKQRYDTAGDYYKENGDWKFTISKMDGDKEFLVLMHELTEWYLTQKSGIKECDITKFDVENVYKLDPVNSDDPGMSKKSPYHKEHLAALRVEKLLAKFLKVDWSEYDDSFGLLVY